MWKEKAKEYLEYSIKSEVFESIKIDTGGEGVTDYLKYLDKKMAEVSAELWRALADEVPVPARGDMLALSEMIEGYLDYLNWDWVFTAENGLDLAINGAYMWIDAISIFFVTG